MRAALGAGLPADLACAFLALVAWQRAAALLSLAALLGFTTQLAAILK